MRHARRLLLLLALAALGTGCASTADHAPTPYTADAIRLANPPGTVIVFRIEEAGKAPVRSTMRFVSGDADGCEIEETVHAADGAVLAPPTRNAAQWPELRDHALFPAATTRRSRAQRTVAVGACDCWLYEVEGEGDAVGTVRRLYFARDRPGPPVLYETIADGVVVFRMEMIEDSRGM